MGRARREGAGLQTLRDVERGLQEGRFDQELSRVYGAGTHEAEDRLLALLHGFRAFFGPEEEAPVCLFSAPGRTEIGGNHTDHQRGRGLAASVDLDTIACVTPTHTGRIRIKSANHRLCEIDLAHLDPQEGELGHSPSLVRGIAARITRMGYPVGGFDAYTTTRVLRGSGLSSSATFEVLVGAIINHLFCGGSLTAMELAQVAQYAENAYFGKPSGMMDPIACATGGVMAIDFSAQGEAAVQKVSFDLAAAGYAMCIVDSGVSHAGLHAEYAAIPEEMGRVAACFGKRLLTEVPEEAFFDSIAALCVRCGDRSVLRAIHFFSEQQVVLEELEAVRRGDMDRFLRLVRKSGRTSWMYLQNISTARDPKNQGLGVLLAMAERLLGERGACRVHGGGFAGTIQVFLPLKDLERFRAGMEAVSGDGSCHVLTFRDTGTCTLIS